MFGGPAITTSPFPPLGKTSTRLPVSVAAVALVFPRVMVSVLVPPGAIIVGLKAFDMVGGVLTTSVADALLALLP